MEAGIKVSIIIPVYNSEQYLSKCLESVLHQTLEDIEIICVDDCSTDSSKSVLETFARKDERIKVLHNSENMGLSYTRNRALEEASGEYVQFLDSDDYLNGDGVLEMLYSIAGNSHLELLKSQIVLSKNGNVEKWVQYPSEVVQNVFTGRELLYRLELHDVCLVGAYTNFVRLDFLRGHDLSFYNGILHEDVLFSYELYGCASRAMCVNEDTYVYVKHEDTITTRPKSVENLKGYLISMNEILKRDIFSYPLEFGYATMKYLMRMFREMRKIQKQIGCIAESELHSAEEISDLYSKMFIKGRWQYINIKTALKSIDAMAQSDRIYLYGAGKAAMELLEFLTEHDICIDGVFVADTTQSSQTLLGHKVRCIDEYQCEEENALFLVAITQLRVGDAVGQLRARGVGRIIYMC